MNRRFKTMETLAIRPWGIVLKALDQRTQKRVILKGIVKDAPSALLKQFERECAFLRSHVSSSMPVYIETFADERYLYLAESCFEGCVPLKDWMKKVRSKQRRQSLFISLLGLIGHVHQKGFLYVDFKMDHILVKEDGRPCLIDFNSIVPIGSKSLATANLNALSPEARKSKALDERADIFGIAEIYGALFGKDSLYWMARQNDPDRRFSSTQAFAAAFDKTKNPKTKKRAALILSLLMGSGVIGSQSFALFMPVYSMDQSDDLDHQAQKILERQDFAGAKMLLDDFDRALEELDLETLSALMVQGHFEMDAKQSDQVLEKLLDLEDWSQHLQTLSLFDGSQSLNSDCIQSLKEKISALHSLPDRQAISLLRFLLLHEKQLGSIKLDPALEKQLMEKDASRQLLGHLKYQNNQKGKEK